MTTDPDEIRQWESHPLLLYAAANAARRVYIYHYYRLSNDFQSGEAIEVRRIAKKHPGFSDPQYLVLIRYFGELLNVAKDAVPRHVVHRQNKRSKYAEAEDVDADACFTEVNELAPGFARDVKHSIIAFSIWYWYLK